jgi:hypothetical protein
MTRQRREDWQEIADRVCASIALGESLRKSCEKEGLSAGRFLGWVRDDQELTERYTRAREIGNDVEFERFQSLAEELPERTERGVDSGWVQWQRLRMDAARWALSKKAPQKYGERLEHRHSGSVGLQINIATDDD